VIKYARPHRSEAGVLAAFMLRSWQSAYADIVPPTVWWYETEEAIEQRWKSHLSKPERHILAAYNDGQLAGVILYGEAKPRHIAKADGHITSLYVDAALHGQGIGKALLTCAAREWLMCGGQSLSVGVLKDNVKARAFYEATGATLQSEGIFRWHGHDLPELIYHYKDTKSLAEGYNSAKVIRNKSLVNLSQRFKV
jgi:ribosomal protein S18 acetylase RimI-like enzyme